MVSLPILPIIKKISLHSYFIFQVEQLNEPQNEQTYALSLPPLNTQFEAYILNLTQKFPTNLSYFFEFLDQFPQKEFPFQSSSLKLHSWSLESMLETIIHLCQAFPSLISQMQGNEKN